MIIHVNVWLNFHTKDRVSTILLLYHKVNQSLVIWKDKHYSQIFRKYERIVIHLFPCNFSFILTKFTCSTIEKNVVSIAHTFSYRGIFNLLCNLVVCISLILRAQTESDFSIFYSRRFYLEWYVRTRCKVFCNRYGMQSRRSVHCWIFQWCNHGWLTPCSRFSSCGIQRLSWTVLASKVCLKPPFKISF